MIQANQAVSIPVIENSSCPIIKETHLKNDHSVSTVLFYEIVTDDENCFLSNMPK